MAENKSYAELRRLAEAATAGKWYAAAETILVGFQDNDLERPIERNLGEMDSLANANFVAAAHPEMILDLLDALDARS